MVTIRAWKHAATIDATGDWRSNDRDLEELLESLSRDVDRGPSVGRLDLAIASAVVTRLADLEPSSKPVIVSVSKVAEAPGTVY